CDLRKVGGTEQFGADHVTGETSDQPAAVHVLVIVVDEVWANAHMIDSSDGRDVLNVVDDSVGRGTPRVNEVWDGGSDVDQAAQAGDARDGTVREVAMDVGDGPAGRMSGENGTRREFQKVVDSAESKVADVEHHAKAFHLLDYGYAFRCQAAA